MIDAPLLQLGASSLDRISQQIPMFSASRANSADYSIAMHATFAAKLGASADVVEPLRNGGAIHDQKLEAVRRFAAAIATNRTQVSDSDVDALKGGWLRSPRDGRDCTGSRREYACEQQCDGGHRTCRSP
ncbi:carboxymuconolactone decarboxylase family protein [Paraburkholderia franconis]|uniref:carboxymuconolactone decarboxylase family protein n=1 Tax=Paraburkholderia franconis TaxID=2654983 RepID=UPI001D0FF67C|nr:hypothetical protein [Paraburkholderia franconis]